jgi:hypothetical protein
MSSQTERNRLNPEAYVGPYRPIRKGEIVDPVDMQFVEKHGLVPEHIYGGRRAKLTVIHERRRPLGEPPHLIIPK